MTTKENLTEEQDKGEAVFIQHLHIEKYHIESKAFKYASQGNSLVYTQTIYLKGKPAGQGHEVTNAMLFFRDTPIGSPSYNRALKRIIAEYPIKEFSNYVNLLQQQPVIKQYQYHEWTKQTEAILSTFFK